MQRILGFFFRKKTRGFELIDNLDVFVRDKLNLILSDATFFDIATGYFSLTGWELFAQSIEDLLNRGGNIRLIIGAVSRDELSIDTARLLLRLIKNPKIQARTIKPRRLHSKLFIAGNDRRVSILFGSSNITYGGLIQNIELNTLDELRLKDERALKFCAWFERIWQEAAAIDLELVQEIKDAAKEIKPQYYQLLYDSLILEDLKRLDLKDIGNFVPFDFQVEDATALATRFLVHPGEPRGWFIAHEVGLGKTLISAMSIKSLISSSLIKNILAIVPYSIQRQWRQELKLRLELDFKIVTAHNIKRISNLGLHLISYDLVRERIGEIPKNWDLVIVDESHFIRNRETKRWKAINKLMPKFWLFLTATPMHNKIEDLLSQLKVFVPETILERATRREVSHIDRTRLFRTFVHRRLQKDALKDILPKRHIKEPQLVALSKSEKTLYSGLKKFLSEVSVYYKIISRSMRFIIPFIKQIYLEEFTSSKEAFLLGIKNLKQKIKEAFTTGVVEYNFGSLSEGAEDSLLEEMRTFLEDELESEGKLEFYRDDKGSAIIKLPLDEKLKEDLKGDLKYIEEILENNTAKIDEFSKIKATLELIKTISPGPENKLIVFVRFIETGKILTERINELRVKSNFFYGELEDSQREKLLNRFRLAETDERVDVLVATDAAYVGLNLQVANMVIHHDLAWNPMVIEQRIGRIHRIGQRKDVVSFSFLVKDTIDERKYEILGRKTEEIATHLGLSHEVVKKQVSVLTDFQALVANLELGEISQDEFEKRYERLVSDRKEMFELLTDLTETQALLPQLGETQELLAQVPLLLKQLLEIEANRIKARFTPLPENGKILFFEYSLDGKKVKELATFSSEVFIRDLEETLKIQEKYKDKLTKEGVFAISIFHPAVLYLIEKIKDVYSGNYERIVENLPVRCRVEFPNSAEIIQVNYIAEVELENITAGIKNSFKIFVPIILSPKDKKILIDAKMGYELAHQPSTEERKIEELNLLRYQGLIDFQFQKFKDKLEITIGKVGLEIGELEVSKKAYEIEKELEELIKRLERVVTNKVRKKSQGLLIVKEEAEEQRIKERIKIFRERKERPGAKNLIVTVKDFTPVGLCSYKIKGRTQ